MKVVLLRRAHADLLWFRRYYKDVFPEGAARAKIHFRQAIERLTDMPFVGRQVLERAVRVLAVSQTPFLLVYRISGERIDVLRVWDAHADRIEGWTGDGS